MPTKRPRYSLTLDSDLLDRINRYQNEQNIDSQNQAIIDLVNRGIAEMQEQYAIPAFSREEMSVVYAFRYATPQIRSQMLALASESVVVARMRRRSTPIQPPKYDSITLLYGYENAGPERQAQIDSIINEALAESLNTKNEAAEEAAPKERRHLTDEEAIALAQERYGHLFGRHDDDEFEIARQAIDAASASNAAEPERPESTG